MAKLQVRHASIMEIAAYVPGKSSVGGKNPPIKLSSNENPFGASPLAFEAMKKAIEKTNRYPDAYCKELRSAIAKKYGMDAENIVCGAGSDELLSLLCQAYARDGDEVLYSEYGFLMYPISALRVGATPVVAQEKNYKTDIDAILNAVTDKTTIVFLANPNNPTGSYITKQEMRRLRAGLRDDILLVIDAAYAEYVDESDYSSGMGMVEEFDNVVMTRTFSKIYGLSSLRIGWAYCPSYIADVLNRIRGPFNVSDIAQRAALASIADDEFVEKSKSHNKKWLKIVTDEINDLGLRAFPSVGNFVLVEFSEESGRAAEDAYEFLKTKSIIGRYMESYNLPNCIRFSIGLEKENKSMLAALKEFLG